LYFTKEKVFLLITTKNGVANMLGEFFITHLVTLVLGCRRQPPPGPAWQRRMSALSAHGRSVLTFRACAQH
jgi:hypothetical protein